VLGRVGGIEIKPDQRGIFLYEDGVSPFAECTVADGRAVLKLDAIESGRVFLLRRQ